MTGDAPPFDVPAAFGRFRVLDPYGAGSLGPVFRGKDTSDGRAVAIKVLQLNLPPERAYEVAENLRALADRMPRHPAIASILGTGIEANNPYVASVLAPGQTLDVALRQFGPAAIGDAVPRLAAIAASLDLAAETWTWHGGLHPRDILIADEHTTLVGLGIAPIVERSGIRLPVRRPYTAPEVAEGHATSPAGDQFALAAIAFEWLFGRRARGPADSPMTVPALPGTEGDALSGAFTSALALDPAARFDSCSAFVAALGDAIRDPDAADAVASTRDRRGHAVPEGLPLFVDIERRPDLDVGVPASHQAVAETASEDLGPIAGAESAAEPPAESMQRPAEDEEVEDPGVLLARTASEADAETSERSATEVLGETSAEGRDDESHPAREPLRATVAPRSVRPRPAPRFVEQDPQPVAWQGNLGASEAPRTARRGFGAGTVAAALLAGLVIGGGLGFAVAGRQPFGSSPAIDSAARATLPPESGGRDYTDAPLPKDATGPPAATAQPPVEREVARDSAPASREVGAMPDLGRLLVRSSPSGAEVRVNGVRRGVTPLALRDLPLGTHTVVLTRSGYARAEHRIALTEARPSRSVDARLVTEAPAPLPAPTAQVEPPARAGPRASAASLVVESRPTGARVIVDGREVGTTPLTLDTLAPGAHTVRLERDGYQPWATSVRVGAGERARVAASLVGGKD